MCHTVIDVYLLALGRRGDVPPQPPPLQKARFLSKYTTRSLNVVVYGASSPGILGTGSALTWMDLYTSQSIMQVIQVTNRQ